MKNFVTYLLTVAVLVASCSVFAKPSKTRKPKCKNGSCMIRR